jgi:20S proteasome alpha/beta subunit
MKIINWIGLHDMFTTILLLLTLALLCMVNPTHSIHGGVILAIAGQDSVTLSVDSRFSSPQTGALLLGMLSPGFIFYFATVTHEFSGQQQRGVFRVGCNTIVGCIGLESDVVLLMDELRERIQEYIEDDLEPQTVARLLSDILYKSNFICTPGT